MQELHYLREIISGKEYELRLLRLKLRTKSARYLSNTSPLAKEIKEELKR